MVELSTEGREFYPGYRIPLWINPREDFSYGRGVGSRFRLILVKDGSGIWQVEGRRGAFIAPVLFCLNENERITLEENRGVRAECVYFHPTTINDVFDFNAVRGQGKGLPTSDMQDLYWLTPFIQRSPGSFKPIPLGPVGAHRVSELFQALGRELSVQSDISWPCRSRSYFLELLLLVGRVCEEAGTQEESSLSGANPGIEAVLMHLHANYPQRITLADLTRMFHTNRTTLEEQFFRATGLSVMAYLTRLRMRVASMILRDTELDISQVMQRVGFRDNTHFSRTFRRFLGCTPREYRRRYCWMVRNKAGSSSADVSDCVTGPS
jgi:AraC-like DNA-binding protein